VTTKACVLAILGPTGPRWGDSYLPPGPRRGLHRATSTCRCCCRKSRSVLCAMPRFLAACRMDTPRATSSRAAETCSSARGFTKPLLSAPASRPDRFPGHRLAVRVGYCDLFPQGLPPPIHAHAGHTSGTAGIAGGLMKGPTGAIPVNRIPLGGAAQTILPDAESQRTVAGGPRTALAAAARFEEKWAARLP